MRCGILSAMSDWADDPLAKRWLRRCVDELAPKISASAFTVSIVPSDEGDAKFWVELGASIMLDKPIIAVCFDHRSVPRKLRYVADEIVYCPVGVGPDSSEAVSRAIERVMRKQRRPPAPPGRRP